MKKLIIFGLIVVIVLLAAKYPHVMLNPGELSQGHQDLGNKCYSCHTPFSGIENDKCIACHKVSEIGLDTKIAQAEKVVFHEQLLDQTCTSCHTDHNGINPDLSLTNFEHTLIAKTVINDCIKCHQKPADKLHEQLSASCNKCHTTNEWKLTGPFDHAMIAKMKGKNALVATITQMIRFTAQLKIIVLNAMTPSGGVRLLLTIPPISYWMETTTPNAILAI
ncbi:MAG: cytochrome c3 family protein [Saprospiraceae bacterium]|nr:cytochrome c3 family protein [Saprospiraceae bacterium]